MAPKRKAVLKADKTAAPITANASNDTAQTLSPPSHPAHLPYQPHGELPSTHKLIHKNHSHPNDHTCDSYTLPLNAAKG